MERSILVIDDEKRLAESLAELLRTEGYDVGVAVGGAAGLEELARRPYKLVITDLRMPEVDGFQIMDQVARNHPDTSLIVITGHASTQSAIEAIHQRVADYITKPFEFDFLLASIEKVFAQIEARELREDLMRMISHDIKVPLNSIMGFAMFIVDPKTGETSPKAGEYAEKIVLNSQRILALLDNYLTHARAESGRLEIMAQPMKVEDTLDEAVKLMAGEFRRKEVELDTDLEPLGAPMRGDEHLIFRAVSNLLSNAMKYTPRGGRAKVRLRRGEREGTGPVAIISVGNTGPGIPPGDVPRVFDKYRRSSTSRGIEGSGLGLYVVQEVARCHGGWAECESEENLITRFRIVLPLAGPPETKAAG